MLFFSRFGTYFVDKSLLNFHSLHELVIFNEIYRGISYHFGSHLWSTNNDKDTDIGAHQIQKIVGHGHDIYMYIKLKIKKKFIIHNIVVML